MTRFFRKMYKIRRFEETILDLFSENILSGTTHTCIGQESIAVTVMEHLEKDDIVFSNHRCHGHFIAYSDNIKVLLAEIMGNSDGVCGGKGGSQHLCYRRFFSNGIQGGIVPNAVGMAWGEKIKGTDNIAIVFLGDGTLGQGVVYESINMASLFEIPILFIVENNEYAMSTKRSDALAGTIEGRFRAFHVECSEIDDSNIEELDQSFRNAVLYVRTKKKPFCQIVNTYRLAAHSKGDDFRDSGEVERHWQEDPLKKLENVLDFQECEKIKGEIDSELSEIVEFCRDGINKAGKKNVQVENPVEEALENSLINRDEIKHVYQINYGLEEILQNNPKALLLGEDIRDPYGGAFKVTKGLSEKFPRQVVNTPISEAGIIGIGVGLAMNGIKSIVEIMFGDFISLGFDQILNHAVKYHDMYHGQVSVPVLIRVPSGGGRGYGATHSQSLEKFFVGVPGLTIIALSPVVDCEKLLVSIEKNIKGPTLLIENKKMYGNRQMAVHENRFEEFYVEEIRERFPLYKLSLDMDEAGDVLILTYGGMLSLAMEAAKQLLLEEEILVNILLITKISPIEYRQLADYVGDEKIIVTLEEGTRRGGWGSEIVAGLCELLHERHFIRLGARDCAISCNKTEEQEILPNLEYVIDKIKETVYEKNNC